MNPLSTSVRGWLRDHFAFPAVGGPTRFRTEHLLGADQPLSQNELWALGVG